MSLLLAGTASASGKTTAAIGLIAALKASGRQVQPAKAGPDFLDAAWLARAADRPCPNLDAFMAAGPNDLIQILAQFANPADFLLVEGAMGLYDGDEQGSASSAALAALLQLPVLLLLNAKGMGQSIAALAQGFLSYTGAALPASLRFCGIICSHVTSQRHERILREALAPVLSRFKVPLLGCLRTANAPQIPSRHLGLIQAQEKDLDFAAAGEWFARQIDLDTLLTLPAMNFGSKNLANTPPTDAPVIAIARDEAFSFCYADLPLFLQRLGAHHVFFSPLADSAPPPCDGVYLPGGYPELFARQLAANVPMRSALKGLAAIGIPIYAECGGYMYLLKNLRDSNGALWPMSDILPGTASMGKKLAALGYRFGTGSWPESCAVRGHEFHYAKAESTCAQPLWQLQNSRGENLGPCGCRAGNSAGSWLHLYPAGSQNFWCAWLNLVRSEKNRRIKYGVENIWK